MFVAAGLLLAVFAAQALGAVSAPQGATLSTQSMLGQTGFEYLGGVRKFAAAVLWNRLEPQFHEYGVGSVDQRLEFLPTMHMVLALDPQFQQAYYVSAFMLARNGRMPQALALAREGIANNPKAGLMRASYAQLLLMEDKAKNLPQAIEQARLGTEPDTTWASPDDKFEGYGIFRTVFTLAGDKAAAQRMQDAQNELSGQGAGLGVERD